MRNDWRELNGPKGLMGMSEAEVKAAIDYELRGPKRKYILERLHQRFNVLRTARERAEIMSKIA